MLVVFANSGLARVETDEAAKTKLPVAVIMAARKKLNLLRAAPDERTLRNWKSLHYEKLKGDKGGMSSIRLNDQFRMTITVNTETKPEPTVTIHAIEDYH
jgi:proteic killer suppression protein